MQTTVHFDRRTNQRGLRREIIDLALALGDAIGDRYVLTTSIIDQELALLNGRKQALLDARKKGCVVVVKCQDTLITSFRTENFRRKTRKK